MRSVLVRRAPSPVVARVSLAATAWAVGLLAWDHLWGNDRGPGDSFPVDPAAFLVTLGLVLVAGAVVFGVTVPRALHGSTTIQRAALVHSGVAVVLAPVAAWLGFPVMVAGGGIALGLRARAGESRGVATVAVALGLLAIVVATLAMAFPATGED